MRPVALLAQDDSHELFDLDLDHAELSLDPCYSYARAVPRGGGVQVEKVVWRTDGTLALSTDADVGSLPPLLDKPVELRSAVDVQLADNDNSTCRVAYTATNQLQVVTAGTGYVASDMGTVAAVDATMREARVFVDTGDVAIRPPSAALTNTSMRSTRDFTVAEAVTARHVFVPFAAPLAVATENVLLHATDPRELIVDTHAAARRTDTACYLETHFGRDAVQHQTQDSDGRAYVHTWSGVRMPVRAATIVEVVAADTTTPLQVDDRSDLGDLFYVAAEGVSYLAAPTFDATTLQVTAPDAADTTSTGALTGTILDDSTVRFSMDAARRLHAHATTFDSGNLAVESVAVELELSAGVPQLATFSTGGGVVLRSGVARDSRHMVVDRLEWARLAPVPTSLQVHADGRTYFVDIEQTALLASMPHRKVAESSSSRSITFDTATTVDRVAIRWSSTSADDATWSVQTTDAEGTETTVATFTGAIHRTHVDVRLAPRDVTRIDVVGGPAVENIVTYAPSDLYDVETNVTIFSDTPSTTPTLLSLHHTVITGCRTTRVRLDDSTQATRIAAQEALLVAGVSSTVQARRRSTRLRMCSGAHA